MFSSTLKITDTNDFIAPSLECVVVDNKPVLMETDGVGEVKIQRPRGGVGPMSVASTTGPDSAVKISLHDCLACSGCVTSAETVLLEQQSIDQFQQMLADPEKQVVVTISNQSLASLACKVGVEPGIMAGRLARSLKAGGARAVFDISVASKIALVENVAEFERRVGWVSTPGGSADDTPMLPMLASSCPGWVLYVEKTHPHLIPYVSRVKSPQAIMGTLIKQFWCATEEVRLAPDAIFHVAVMPCYDKKLEAVREELMVGSVPETDCVLTTGELETWFEKYGSGSHLNSTGDHVWSGNLDTLFSGADDLETDVPQSIAIGDADAVESGGYMNALYRSIRGQDDGQVMPLDAEVPIRTGRNADVRECDLQLQDGRTLHFAILNGFRNIQALVRKIKLKKCTYDYVEVMACPSGCVNGAGQLPPNVGQTEQGQARPPTQAERDETLDAVKNAMHGRVRANTEDAGINAQCAAIYRHWVGHGGTDRQVFSTSLRSTESKAKQSMLAANW
jgi:iron only hydrogenase large subunit-like protein